MPRPPSVLSKVISVTFVGRGPLPENYIHHLLAVRRQAVLDALEWLRTHNTKYYGDIAIDRTLLATLPEDGVPLEGGLRGAV